MANLNPQITDFPTTVEDAVVYFQLFPQMWDEAAYLSANSDVDKNFVGVEGADSNTDPWANTWGPRGLTHFIRYGRNEGRAFSIADEPQDISAFTNLNIDVTEPNTQLYNARGFDLGIFDVINPTEGLQENMVQNESLQALQDSSPFFQRINSTYGAELDVLRSLEEQFGVTFDQNTFPDGFTRENMFQATADLLGTTPQQMESIFSDARVVLNDPSFAEANPGFTHSGLFDLINQSVTQGTSLGDLTGIDTRAAQFIQPVNDFGQQFNQPSDFSAFDLPSSDFSQIGIPQLVNDFGPAPSFEGISPPVLPSSDFNFIPGTPQTIRDSSLLSDPTGFTPLEFAQVRGAMDDPSLFFRRPELFIQDLPPLPTGEGGGTGGTGFGPTTPGSFSFVDPQTGIAPIDRITQGTSGTALDSINSQIGNIVSSGLNAATLPLGSEFGGFGGLDQIGTGFGSLLGFGDSSFAGQGSNLALNGAIELGLLGEAGLALLGQASGLPIGSVVGAGINLLNTAEARDAAQSLIDLGFISGELRDPLSTGFESFASALVPGFGNPSDASIGGLLNVIDSPFISPENVTNILGFDPLTGVATGGGLLASDADPALIGAALDLFQSDNPLTSSFNQIGEAVIPGFEPILTDFVDPGSVTELAQVTSGSGGFLGGLPLTDFGSFNIAPPPIQAPIPIQIAPVLPPTPVPVADLPPAPPPPPPPSFGGGFF